MDAQVVFKGTPQDLDVIRRALDTHERECLKNGDDPTFSPQFRRDAKAEALRTKVLKETLS